MPKILVVDDEPEIRVLTRMMLEKEDYEVLEARDGDEGLRLLENDKPDLVLLDVMMPGDDGWEVCRRIKNDEATNDIPVVMFTIRTSADSMKQSYECGADAHINKPFETEELLSVVKGFVKK